jgi:hypothetical protein
VHDTDHIVEENLWRVLAQFFLGQNTRVGAEAALHLDDPAHRVRVLLGHQPDASAAIVVFALNSVHVVEIVPRFHRLERQPDFNFGAEV